MPVATKYEGGAAIGARQRIAAAATRMRWLPRRFALLLVLALALLVVTGAQGGADRAAQTEVKLQVLAGPDGSDDPGNRDNVFVTTPDKYGEFTCSQGFVVCTFTYDVDVPTTIRLIAGTSHPTYHFYGWTAVECSDDVNICDLELTGDEPVVSVFALYDPARILVGVAGPGTVKWLGGGPDKECVSETTLQRTCTTEDLPAREPIEFEAESAFPIDWAAGCDPLPNDAKRCVALPENRVVMVGFNGEAPPRPFNVQAVLRVSRTGSGSGRITGPDGLDCGNDCRSKPLDFAKLVTLQAEPAAGSRFDGWIGVCGSNPTCRFAVGPVTSVRARFVQAPPPPPPPPPSPPPPPKLEVRIVSLTSVRKAGRWRVIARIAVNKPVSARARVGRQRRTWGDRTVKVRAGTRSLTVPLTRRARRGKCWFRLVAWAGDERRTLRPRTVKLGR